MPSRLLRASALVVVFAPQVALAQSTVRAGGEFRVSQYTTGDQRLPSAAAGPDGTYFIVWESQFQDGDSFGIFGRFVSAAGAPLGPEFQVNQATLFDQKQPSVTADAAGRYTVVWTGQDVSGGGVFARQYTAAGAIGPEFQVNVFTTGDQFLPRVSAGPAAIGVVWQSDLQDGSAGGVYGRLFSPTGTPVTGEFILSGTTAPNQIAPVVAALDNGRFAVTWAEASSALSHAAILSRLFDGSGSPVAAERRIAATGAYINHHTVAAMPGGRYAVAHWLGFTEGGKDHLLSYDFGTQLLYHGANGTQTSAESAGGAGIGTIASWQPALGGNFTGRFLLAYTSQPGVLPCFTLPPWPGPFCTATSPPDGSGSAVFAKPVGAPNLAPRVQVNTTTGGNQERPAVGADAFGNTLIAWQSPSQDGSGLGVYAQRFGGFQPVSVVVDPVGNGVLDPGMDEVVRTSWRNINGAGQTFGGASFGFIGPAGATYTVVDGLASYGTVPDGATQECTECYGVNVSLSGPRPSVHMDSYFGEALTPAEFDVSMPWRLHVGGSFADVSPAGVFYRHVETLLHNGITSGCGSGNYCPSASTTRAQMPVFVLLAREGAAYAPRACATPVFSDVPADSPFCRWIEELARRGVTSGCATGLYCPDAPVTREQMSVFVLRTLDPALDPPACTTPVFADVPSSSPFCRWIEELVRRGVVGGCASGLYCPTQPVTREQMAVFIGATFGLTLY